MKAKLVAEGTTVTWVVVFDQGEEVISALTHWAASEGISAAQVTAVGAFEGAVIGWFDHAAKNYRRITVGQQCEVLSLIGDIAVGPAAGDGPERSQPHLHVVLGLFDGTTRGGHLLEGHVWPALEMVVRETPAQLHKTLRPDIGLALIDLG